MNKIPSKLQKWRQILWNKHESLKHLKWPRYPKISYLKRTKYPQNLKNEQNTLKTSKMTNITQKQNKLLKHYWNLSKNQNTWKPIKWKKFSKTSKTCKNTLIPLKYKIYHKTWKIENTKWKKYPETSTSLEKPLLKMPPPETIKITKCPKTSEQPKIHWNHSNDQIIPKPPKWPKIPRKQWKWSKLLRKK